MESASNYKAQKKAVKCESISSAGILFPTASFRYMVIVFMKSDFYVIYTFKYLRNGECKATLNGVLSVFVY